MKHGHWSIICYLSLTAVLGNGNPLSAQNMSVDPSGRYYRNASGQPVFMIGYHAWASVDTNTFIDQPAKYIDMLNLGQPYKLNYIRITLGGNRFTGSTNPASWNGAATPVAFAYVSGKADLNQWDATFWNGLRYHCDQARQRGFYVHVAFFDGASNRGGSEAYRYANSYWNVNNQTSNFYGQIDSNGNGNVDEGTEFYKVTDFNNNTGLGFHQRRLIAKAISETASYDNVFYEIGNELFGSSASWNQAVITYAKTLTSRPVTQNGGGLASNRDGWSQHDGDTPAAIKSIVSSIVGTGKPAWDDPDGSALINGSSDDLRRAAWYSFAGGAANWGGFTLDFWGGGSFNATKAGYYKKLMHFITLGGVNFSQMTPQTSLVSNTAENSMLAQTGAQYVAYILNDTSATLNLTSLPGEIRALLFDCKTGQWVGEQTLQGGASRTFNRPAGADDWAIHVRPAGTAITVNLDDPDAPNGLTHVSCCDGNTVPWPNGGRMARANVSDTDHYMYFRVSDGYALNGNKPSQTITVDYFDKGGNLTLQYDATSSAYKSAGTINMTNTNTWKTAVWQVSDAYFGNRQNSGSDFRVAYFGGLDFYLDTIRVETGSQVNVDLGNPDIVNGINHIVCCDGNTVPWPMGGRMCRANNADTDRYFYFNISDAYAFQGNKPNLTFTIDYFDKDNGTFTLQYDAASSAYKTGPSIVFTGTNTWKTVVWSVNDAYCGNRENGGADFRLAYFGGLDFYIDIVKVSN